MRTNKKAEGTASTYLIASIVAISILIIIGTSVNKLADKYDQNNIAYFDNYQATMNNITGVGDTYIGDYDLNQNSTNTDSSRYEDHLFFKALEVIRKTPSLLKGIGMGVVRLGADLSIPVPFVVLIISILGISLITAVIKIVRGFNNV